jgi:trans-2,3-dihydro-3-hydroxyanthranilate isomerase
MRRRELLMSMLATSPRRFSYEVWDVFTRTPLTGNPLCVFTDARGMSDAEMQAVARETNLSETTFVIPPWRVRIFSPTAEYPFAGHPTLGTALALRRKGETRVVLEENIGPIPVEFSERDGAVFGDMRQTDPVFGERHDPATIAALLRVTPGHFAPARPILNVSTGRPNLIVCFATLAALRAAEPDWPSIQRYFAAGDPQRGFYFLAQEGARFHARKLTARGEDPVTGSAAGAAIAYLVEQGAVKSGERIVMHQGAEMKRPGELYVSAVRSGGRITDVRVGGFGVRVMTGELTLP